VSNPDWGLAVVANVSELLDIMQHTTEQGRLPQQVPKRHRRTAKQVAAEKRRKELEWAVLERNPLIKQTLKEHIAATTREFFDMALAGTPK